MIIEHRFVCLDGDEWSQSDDFDAYDKAARNIFEESADEPNYLGGVVVKVTIHISDGTKLQYRPAN